RVSARVLDVARQAGRHVLAESGAFGVAAKANAERLVDLGLRADRICYVIELFRIRDQPEHKLLEAANFPFEWRQRFKMVEKLLEGTYDALVARLKSRQRPLDRYRRELALA